MYLMLACRFITINNFIALNASILFEEMLKKECCKHCRHVKFKDTMTKWPVHRKTHRTIQNTEHQDATDIQENKLLCVFVI